MQIRNDTNTELSLYHDYLFLIGGKELSAPFEEFVRLANFSLDTFTRKVFKADSRWQYDDANKTKIPVATVDLEAGATHIPLELDHVRVERFRIKDKQGNWKTLRPVDRRDLSDDELSATGEPETYDKLGNNVFPHPVPDYSAEGGAELQFQGGTSYFTTSDTTKQPGFAPQFHRYVSLLSARDKVLSGSIPNRLQYIDTEIQRLDQDLMDFFAFRDRDERPHFGVQRTTELY